MGLAAGKLRHRVRLMRPEPPGADRRDALGQPANAPAQVAVVWAAIEPLSSQELFWGEAVKSTATVKITIRYRGDVGSRWFFEYDDPGSGTMRTLYIESSNCPDERREFLECRCGERAQVG